MKVLIIEDDKDTQLFLQERLEEKCFAIDIAADGQTGIRLAKANDYDIILLDYLLPEKNGFEVCKEIREQLNHDRSSTPIIMMSVIKDSSSKIEGLDLGADDYVTKPFFFDELFARIQAVLRRPPIHQESLFKMDDLVLDSQKQRVTRGKNSIYLTKKEFALLEFLLRNSGKVVSRNSITEHVWDMNIDPFSNTIEMHILNLRKKLKTPNKPDLIHSFPGRGYKIDLSR
jgi:DNA-binding response OmpR family regulator